MYSCILSFGSVLFTINKEKNVEESEEEKSSDNRDHVKTQGIAKDYFGSKDGKKGKT